MSDLEMTKLCAEAMGFYWAAKRDEYPYIGMHKYDPLHDDAQAMALVKKFCLSISADWAGERHDSENVIWWVTGDTGQATDRNLNRAIVECVAKMQAAKTPAPPLP